MVFFSGAVAAATLVSVSPGLTGEIGVTLDAALVAVAAGVAHLLRRRVIVALELLLLFLAPPSRALNVLMKKRKSLLHCGLQLVFHPIFQLLLKLFSPPSFAK